MLHQTQGGTTGHWFRRLIHLTMAIVPVIYYWFATSIADFFHLTINQIVSLCILIILLLETFRLYQGWTVFGQRDYEAKQISAFAWSGFSVCLVLLIAPKFGLHGAAIGAPLIWSMGFADPLMGECRRKNDANYWSLIAGFIVVALVWLFAIFYLHTPWLLLPFIAPLTVFAESIKTNVIDDNALMLLVPLAAIFILLPWI